VTAVLLTLVLAALAGTTAAAPSPPPTAAELRQLLEGATGPRRLDLQVQLAEVAAESAPDEGVTLAEQAIELARSQKNAAAESSALLALALARRARGEYQLGNEAARRALALGEKPPEPLLAARAHNVLGLLAASEGDPGAALRHSLEAQTLFERTTDRRGLSQALNNVGNSLRRLGDYERALDFHGRSLAMMVERPG
jgi:tetratricopeptide (TPR) repeat protein